MQFSCFSDHWSFTHVPCPTSACESPRTSGSLPPSSVCYTCNRRDSKLQVQTRRSCQIEHFRGCSCSVAWEPLILEREQKKRGSTQELARDMATTHPGWRTKVHPPGDWAQSLHGSVAGFGFRTGQHKTSLVGSLR